MTTFDIYLRVSRVGGRENMISPDEQERRARDLARERGLTVGKVLVDLDESGGKWERPGLQEALERVRTGVSGGLIVAWLDRLSRDSEHAHRLIRELHESGGTVYAPDAPADWTSPEGELHAGIVFTFAQYVRKRARAGFERSKLQAVERGIPVTNRTPVGYRKRADRTLEPDPAAAPVVRELFERRAVGAGPSELADLLNAHGISTSQGSTTWSKQAVAALVKSRVYLGELSYGKDRRFVNPNAHEPIVDLSTWLAAQHPNGRRLQEARRGSYALTGVLRCAACGYSLQGTRSSRGKRRYRCVRRHAGGICPDAVSVSADLVEAVAERIFWSVIEDLTVPGERDDGDDLSAHLSAIERTERRLAQALTPEMQDAAGDAWAELVKERRREHEQAAEALGKARAQLERERERAIPEAASLRMLWPQLSPSERRELFAARFDTIALRRGTVGLELVSFLAGEAPVDLSAPGYRREPKLRPIPAPPDARVTPLEDAGEGVHEPRLRLVS